MSYEITKELQNPRTPIRVGLVLEDQVAPRWVHEIIEELLRADYVDLIVIVFSPRGHARRLGARSILFTLWRRFDGWAFRNDVRKSELRTYPVKTLTFTLGDGNGKHALPNADLIPLRECKLDVLVQLGSGDLTEDFLSCATYGVWTFDYGKYTEAKGEVALFWNLNARGSMYELVLRAATGYPRREWVLCRRFFPRHLFSLEYNLTLDCRRRAQILLQSLSELHRGGWASIVIQNTDANVPGVRIDCTSLSRLTVLWLARSLRRLLERVCFREQWVLAYGETKAKTAQGELDPLTIVVPPRGQHYADPSLFQHKGKTYIFFEVFADDGPGAIYCAGLRADGSLGDTQCVLAGNYHHSYPSVFNWNGDIYLLPETFDNRTIEIYRSIDFPQRWQLAAVLLKNVTLVDPTILDYKGKLWLFAAGFGGPGTQWSELSLFFADSLFGEWRWHPKNPIVRDVRRARPAGRLFFQDGLLIRPGQDCSERYGHSISLNRIDLLSETDYKETFLTTILPNWMPGLCATHTFNQQNGFRVLDGQLLLPRWEPVVEKLRLFLRVSRLRDVSGRRRSLSEPHSGWKYGGHRGAFFTCPSFGSSEHTGVSCDNPPDVLVERSRRGLSDGPPAPPSC